MWARRGSGREVGQVFVLRGRLRGRFVPGGRWYELLFLRRDGSTLGRKGRFSFRF